MWIYNSISQTILEELQMKHFIKQLGIKDSIELAELLKEKGIAEIGDNKSLLKTLKKSDYEIAASVMDFVIEKNFEKFLAINLESLINSRIHEYMDKNKRGIDKLIDANEKKTEKIELVLRVVTSMNASMLSKICRLKFNTSKKIINKFTFFNIDILLERVIYYLCQSEECADLTIDAAQRTELMEQLLNSITSGNYEHEINEKYFGTYE